MPEARFTHSLEGNWLLLKPHIDALERGGGMSDEECIKICGKPLMRMLSRIRGHLMRSRGFHACIRDHRLHVKTNSEQDEVLAKALTATRRKLGKAVQSHAGVEYAKLSETEKRTHDYTSAKATFMLKAYKELRQLSPAKE